MTDLVVWFFRTLGACTVLAGCDGLILVARRRDSLTGDGTSTYWDHDRQLVVKIVFWTLVAAVSEAMMWA